MKLLEIGGTSSVNAYLFLGDYASMLLQQRPSVIDFPLRTWGRKNTIDMNVFCYTLRRLVAPEVGLGFLYIG